MSFDPYARAALDIWSETVVGSQPDGFQDAMRYERLVDIPGMNLQHMEMDRDDPYQFSMHVHIESTDQMRDGCVEIGDYPDPSYVSEHVVGYYLEARDTKRPRIDTVSARMCYKYIIYDRIILPEKTESSRSKWAVSISLPRLILPVLNEKPDLTSREQDIVDALILGNTAKEIARLLGLSPKTVENRIGAIKTKFGARNLQHLVSLAISGSIS